MLYVVCMCSMCMCVVFMFYLTTHSTHFIYGYMASECVDRCVGVRVCTCVRVYVCVSMIVLVVTK